MQDGIVTQPLLFLKFNFFKDLEDFFQGQEAYQGLLGAFWWEAQYSICEFALVRIHKADHFRKGFERSQTAISCPCDIGSIRFQMVQKGQD
jgi:hypothetical protein